MNMNKELMKNIALLGIALVCSLLVAEVLLRIMYPQNSYFEEYSPLIGEINTPFMKGWSISPNGEYKIPVEMNKDGFRDKNHDFEKKEGVVRIAFVGDSFTEGKQVLFEETFHQRIEKILNGKVEVMSFGSGGFGTCEELALYRNYVRKYDPNVVVLMFLTINDFLDNYAVFEKHTDRFTCNFEKDKVVYVPPPPNKMHDFLRPFYKSSHLIRFFYRLKSLHKEDPSLVPPAFEVYYDEYSPQFEESVNVTKRILREIRKEVEQDGASFLLVTLTNPEQVEEDLFEKKKEQLPILKEKITNTEKADELLFSFAQQEKMSIVQLVYPFKEYKKEHPQIRLHYPLDGHWNAQGHALVAELLSEEIQQQYLEEKD